MSNQPNQSESSAYVSGAVYLVMYPSGGLRCTVLEKEEAERLARQLEGVYVELPIKSECDFRNV